MDDQTLTANNNDWAEISKDMHVRVANFDTPSGTEVSSVSTVALPDDVPIAAKPADDEADEPQSG